MDREQLEQAKREAEAAMPWEEVERLAHEIDDSDASEEEQRRRISALVKRVARERPILGETMIYFSVCLMLKSPDDETTAPL